MICLEAIKIELMQLKNSCGLQQFTFPMLEMVNYLKYHVSLQVLIVVHVTMCLK